MKTTIKKIFLVFFFIIVTLSTTHATPKNVLIEYVTGTWCGNCPCGHQTLNGINSMYPQTIVIAYHAFNSDPWKNFNGNEIVGLLGFVATPTANIDRNNTVGNGNYSLWTSGVQDRYSSMPESKVDLIVSSKTYNESTRELNISVNTTALENLSGQYKITFVITESNLIYPQNFYSQCGTPGYVNDYNHKHAARTILNGASGENLNSGNTWNQNETFTKNISTVIDAAWNPSNCKVVMFVNKQEDNFSQSMIMQAIEVNVTGTSGIVNTNSNPETFQLYQNYPNPFNPNTVIRYSLTKNSFTSLKVYDMMGKEISSLVNEKQNAGTYEVSFDGSNLSSGIYFYALTSGGFSDKRKMILVK